MTAETRKRVVKAEHKRALRDYMTSRIHRGDAFIRYERGLDGKLFLCLAAVQSITVGDVPIIMVGWAKCSRRDQFNRKLGLKIALSRALSGLTYLSSNGDWFVLSRVRDEVDVGKLQAHAIAASEYFAERAKRALAKAASG